MGFEDHFSRLASGYARFRPHYPAALFSYLAELAQSRQLAWDCATGSGQAALGLAKEFEQVIATDASQEQIEQAAQHPHITYRVEPAESTTLDAGRVDLVTAAVAVHWFDLERFYPEVRRVLKPGGVLAVWTYHRPRVTPEVDQLIARLEIQILGAYWPERLHYLQEHYQTLPFPFHELAPPEFAIRAGWKLEQLVGFINSWSAVSRYQENRKAHPLEPLWDEFLAAWGDEEAVRDITWPLYMRVGRIPN